MPKKKYIFALLLLIFAFLGCSKEDEAPMGFADFDIDLADARNSNLLIVGGWEYYTGGYNGVVVFNYSGNEFIAFERACPKDHKCAVDVDDSGVTLSCPCCGSTFIYTDGTPISGPAKAPLQQYITYFDGRVIQVRNF